MRGTGTRLARSTYLVVAEMATSKGGYDYEFITPPDKSLECPVCLLTLRDPYMISCCGNEFCQRCIERDGKPCPLCIMSLTSRSYNSSRGECSSGPLSTERAGL